MAKSDCAYSEMIDSNTRLKLTMPAMKMRTSCFTHSASVMCLAATALLLGCAGVSSGSPKPIPPPPSDHSVYLSCNASASQDVSGYNVYRAVYSNSCGSFSRINSALSAGTSYTDSTVVTGASYCYAATAVSTSNEESSPSDIVSDVQIPTS